MRCPNHPSGVCQKRPRWHWDFNPHQEVIRHPSGASTDQMGSLDIQAYLSITRYHIPSQWASVKECLVDTQDLQHHQPVVTRTHHTVVLVKDTCGTVMRHFYTSQPESYQVSISGEPEILHSPTVTMSTISLKCQWMLSGWPGLPPSPGNN